MSNLETAFIYQDSKGNITARVITDISQTDEYLQGFCHTANGLRTFRKDRIVEELKGTESIEVKLNYYISINPIPKALSKSHDLPDVCFTGFKNDDKKRLIEQAESKDMIIRSSVTRNLNFLCCGYSAGPAKVKKARAQGVVTLSEVQFRELLETGEVPERT